MNRLRAGKAVIPLLLPTKGVSAKQSLISVGGELLALLEAPATPSELLDRTKNRRAGNGDPSQISYEWFSLALTTLFAINAVQLDHGGKVRRTDVPA